MYTKLPQSPGVYLMKNRAGKVIYVGRATSLRDRVRSYFDAEKALTDIIIPVRPIEEAIGEVVKVDWIKTPSLLEAVILEANLIKKLEPRYNIKDKDDRSFLYIAITGEEYPKVRLVRGQELRSGDKNFLLRNSAGLARLGHRPRPSDVDAKVGQARPASNSPRAKILPPSFQNSSLLALFGPFPSASLARAALDILRKIFHWSNCAASSSAPCFYYRLGQCPGICTGEITPAQYKKTVIKPLNLFLEGKRAKVLKSFEVRMRKEAKRQHFEEAARFRNQLFALKHVNDVALIGREEFVGGTDPVVKQQGQSLLGRIEGYDISNISGKAAVGSMVVFENGKPEKSEYRKFKIKWVKGINDVAMLMEVLSRRFSHHSSLITHHASWPLPDLVLIDGGRGQVGAAEEAMLHENVSIPVLGIAKGFARKNDHFIFGKNMEAGVRQELERLVDVYPNLLKHVRDEAHRFAVQYHKLLRRFPHRS